MTQTYLILGIAILGGAVFLAGLVMVLSGPTSMQERIRDYVTQEAPPKEIPTYDTSLLSRFRLFLNTAGSFLQTEKSFLRLSSANWKITMIEYSLIRYGITIFSLILGWVFWDIIIGVFLSVFVYMVPEILLSRAIHGRRTKFQNQLVDLLMLIAGSVRTGYSLQQSMDVVISDMVPPASEEFRRVRREVDLGIPLTQALLNLASRMQSDDLQLVVIAININATVGGNLGRILDTVIETIRDRVRLFNEVRVLTSMARYSSSLLTAMPFLTAIIIFLLNPTYFDAILDPGAPKIIMLIPLTLILVGNIWIRALSDFKV